MFPGAPPVLSLASSLSVDLTCGFMGHHLVVNLCFNLPGPPRLSFYEEINSIGTLCHTAGSMGRLAVRGEAVELGGNLRPWRQREV